MRRYVVFCLVALSVLSGPDAAAQAPPAAEQFQQLELRWMDALAARDAKVLEEMLAREFTIIGAGSSIADATSTRRQWLDVGLNRPFPKHTVKILNVARAGETAVVQCILTGDYPPMPWKPEGGTLAFLVTDTWILRDGRWQVLARHSSLPAAATR